VPTAAKNMRKPTIDKCTAATNAEKTVDKKNAESTTANTTTKTDTKETKH
jgi:hypothetical protein